MYAATDPKVEKLNLPLNPESQQATKNLLGAQEMLEALKKRMAVEPALAGLVVPLTQIHEVSWRPLNSFVHGGLHPLNERTADSRCNWPRTSCSIRTECCIWRIGWWRDSARL